ncbi:MAG TPA: hypothetical protein VKV40_09485 [Ktedonobacteraceae bacterium]|nr:hypothetical protein [Ktedonobacteraceae bacterium]
MYILLSPAQHGVVVTLEEPDDCNRFHVAIRGLPEDAAQQALAREEIGTLEGHEAAWIEIAALRRLAGGRVPSDWAERFEGMLRYAGRKGWLSPDGSRVRGHYEWNR